MASPTCPKECRKALRYLLKALKLMWLLKRSTAPEYSTEFCGVVMALYIHNEEMEKFLKLPSLYLPLRGHKEANQASGCTQALSSQ